MTHSMRRWLIGLVLCLAVAGLLAENPPPARLGFWARSYSADTVVPDDSQVLAEFNFSPIYYLGQFEIEIEADSSIVKNLSCDVIGVLSLGHKIVLDQNHLNFLSSPSQQIDLYDQTHDYIGYGRNYRVRMINNDKSLAGKPFSYKLSFRPTVIPGRALVYLGLVLLYALWFFRITRYRRFCRLSSKVAALADEKTLFWKITEWTAKLLLLLLVLDELGLALNELGIPFAFLTVSRAVMGIPMISYLLYLANLVLIVPATYEVCRAQASQEYKVEPDSYPGFWRDYHKRQHLKKTLGMLSITILLTLVQGLTWNEFNLKSDFGNGYNDLIYYLLLYGLAIYPLLQSISIRLISIKQLPHQSSGSQTYNTLTLFFLSLTQTMITKVILLFSLFNSARHSYRKLLAWIKPGSHKDVSCKDVSFEQNLVIKSGILVEQFGFVFLTLCFLPLLLILQNHASPFAPADSAFPLTGVITSIYTLVIGLYAITKLGKGWINLLLNLAWIASLIFAFYLLPLLRTHWFVPSLDPPGSSFFDMLFEMMSPESGMNLLLVFHLGITILFIVIYNYEKSVNLLKTDRRSLPKAIRLYLTIQFSLIGMMSLIMNVLGFLGRDDTIKVGIALDSGVYGMLFAITRMIIFTFIAGLIYSSLSNRDLYDNLIRIGGQALVDEAKAKSRVLRLFKWFNNKRLSALSLVLILLFPLLESKWVLAMIKKPASTYQSSSTLNWMDPDELGITDIEVSGEQIICLDPKGISSRSLNDSAPEWRVSIDNCQIINILGKMVIAESRLEQPEHKSLRITAFNLENGDQLWHRDPSLQEAGLRFRYLYEDERILAYEAKVRQLLIIDPFSGKEMARQQGVRAMSRGKSGDQYFWADLDGRIFTGEGRSYRQIFDPGARVTGITGSPEGLMLNLENELIWLQMPSLRSIRIPKLGALGLLRSQEEDEPSTRKDSAYTGSYSIQQLMDCGEELVLVLGAINSPGKAVCISSRDGEILWSKNGYSYVYIRHAGASTSSDQAVLLQNEKRKTFEMIDAATGRTLWTRLYKGSHCFFLSGTLWQLDKLYIRQLDESNGKVLAKDPLILLISRHRYKAAVEGQLVEPEIGSFVIHGDQISMVYGDYLINLQFPSGFRKGPQ